MIKYNNRETAERIALKSRHWVVLGDDGLYWVVSGREKSRLQKKGYQLA